MAPENQEEFNVHPLIYEGATVKFYAVNRSLICSARDEAADPARVSSCPSKSANRCPETKIQACRSLFFKNCPAKVFIEDEITESEHAKLFALMYMIDQKRGKIWNTQKFKGLTDVSHRGINFLELKPTDQVRIGCFWGPDYKLYLTHGFYKQRSDWPSNEILTMKNVYDSYIDVENKRAA